MSIWSAWPLKPQTLLIGDRRYVSVSEEDLGISDRPVAAEDEPTRRPGTFFFDFISISKLFAYVNEKVLHLVKN